MRSPLLTSTHVSIPKDRSIVVTFPPVWGIVGRTTSPESEGRLLLGSVLSTSLVALEKNEEETTLPSIPTSDTFVDW